MALHLTIVTPEGEAFDGPCEQVVLPGAEGEFGVLEQHERFLAPLSPGALEIKSAGASSRWAAVTDGFADISAEQAVVLVDRCELAGDIDTADAASQKSDAEAELASLAAGEENAARRTELERQIRVSEVRLEVAARA